MNLVRSQRPTGCRENTYSCKFSEGCTCTINKHKQAHTQTNACICTHKSRCNKKNVTRNFLMISEANI